MPRDNNKRYALQPYRVIGLRFSDGKNIVELCESDVTSDKVAVYVAKEDLWKEVENICDRLIHAQTVVVANDDNMITFHVESVAFDEEVE